MNTDGSFRTDYKSKQIYNDIYFVRGKGGGRESLSSIKERISRGRLKVRRGVRNSPILAMEIHVISTTVVPPSSLISSLSNKITQICLITTSTKS